MEVLYICSGILASGSAWGIVWLCGMGLVRPAVSGRALLRFLLYLFVCCAGIDTFVYCRDIYEEYSVADTATREYILSLHEGSGGWLIVFKLVSTGLPIFYLLKPVRFVSFLVFLVALCFVLLPYYEEIQRHLR